LIGYSPGELLGQPIVDFVHEANVPDLLDAFEEASSSHQGASRAVAVRVKGGDVLPCEAVIVALFPEPSSAFAFIPEGTELLPTSATAQQRLIRRFGGGLWDPATARLTGEPLGKVQLTTREMEIVRLLVLGDRVRSISQRLFLSQSTVRSHLSTIFSKFGVRSQSELLDLLRSGDLDGPNGGRS
jgi:DNA-binding CsgD family transcriptional regulator